MTIRIKGNWKKGFAYDIHTLDSVYMGPDVNGREQWNTTRSEMGELVYQLKYRGNKSAVEKIVILLDRYKGLERMDAIIPIPSTNKNRLKQPVSEIAQALGKRINVTVLEDVLQKRDGGEELKNVDDPNERKKLLHEHMSYRDTHNLSDKNILLVDDLYRSGSTLSVATDLLYQKARVKNVFVLTMTKTRRKR